MKWYLTGDCHRDYLRFQNLEEYRTGAPIGIICLGDFGINYFLNKTDTKMKEWLHEKYPNFIFYLLRGNHEARPEDIPNVEVLEDNIIKEFVQIEPRFPNIRYLIDGSTYYFGDYKCLCIGGAYSVDKWYRLMRRECTEENNNPKITGWFPNEQLTEKERDEITDIIKWANVDFVFTHTCPLSMMPTDLFLNMVDQSTVDNTMEYWLEQIKNSFKWKIWCFGHYHADRLERPYIEQYYKDIEDLDVIWNRWKQYKTTGQLDEWWLNKSPNFYLN